ncbi:lens fiber membrane intrinsic protein-like [Clavelina lepadiformis]|uniref:lens fiber membrane intrinsic protein-like n=1 Tax=Clavelina lepadiformis TaxID=159417 RepID=UPI004040F055
MQLKVALSVEIILTLTVLILTIVSEATSSWVVSGSGVGETSLGLWQSCANGRCFAITDAPPFFEAVRAMSILAIISQALALFAIGYAFKDPKYHPKMCTSFLSMAGLFMVIAMAVFTGKARLSSYGYSYVLGWVSAVANGLVSIVVGCLHR